MVLAIDPHFQGYGNPWFSVQAGACTEIISFPYTPSGPNPTGPKIGLNHPQIAHVRKTVPFRIGAKPSQAPTSTKLEFRLPNSAQRSKSETDDPHHGPGTELDICAEQIGIHQEVPTVNADIPIAANIGIDAGKQLPRECRVVVVG